MKTFLSLWTVLFAVMLGLASCNKNDMPEAPPGTVDPSTLPAAVLQEFDTRYPGATDVSWSIKNDYAVAHFYWDSARSDSRARNHTAWFTMRGEWGMTETEIPFALLSTLAPKVYEAFSASTYGQASSGWMTDDEVDVLLRGEGTEKLYVIEVSNKEAGKETDVDLYYTEGGVLVKEIIDADDNQDFDEYLPQKPAGNIEAWLKQKFTAYTVVEIENEDGRTEVEVIAKGRKHEVLFDASQNWLSVKTDLYAMDANNAEWVPANIVEALQKESYEVSNIKEIERYEVNKSGNEYVYFCFEMRSGRDEVDVYVDETGIISRPSVGGEGVTVEGGITEFLAQKYPGAVVVDKDYDDGYLEIDIRHDNIIKEVKFNGRNEWIKTTWELRYAALPEAIRQTLTKEGYQQADVDDIEVTENASGVLYEVEIEKGHIEKTLIIDAQGVIKQQY